MAEAIALFSYWLIVFFIKLAAYPSTHEPRKPFPRKWDSGNESAIFYSIDFWFSNVFKNRIKQFDPPRSRIELKKYIKLNNQVNVLFSSAIFILLIIAFHYFKEKHPFAYETLLAIGVIRYISRSCEIGIAFGRDVLQSRRMASGLNKYERIKLALLSYLEIFIYSASAYLILPSVKDPLGALSLSLNVGTLTNVGYAFGTEADLFSNIVFVQVFCTLSLVVLSLASYLSRKD